MIMHMCHNAMVQHCARAVYMYIINVVHCLPYYSEFLHVEFARFTVLLANNTLLHICRYIYTRTQYLDGR